MLVHSDRGFRFHADDDMISKLIEITESQGMERVLKLIYILDSLSKKPAEFIAPNAFHNVVSKKSELRINKVCTFIQNNFNQKISLKQVADLIYLTESNFCKFFKKATGKTYSDYLNELRINEACRLLFQTDKTISQVSFECGFETLSYFNRVFLNKKGVTPSMFRKNNCSG
jgi:AraC-like DNA-binding protein